MTLPWPRVIGQHLLLDFQTFLSVNLWQYSIWKGGWDHPSHFYLLQLILACLLLRNSTTQQHCHSPLGVLFQGLRITCPRIFCQYGNMVGLGVMSPALDDFPENSQDHCWSSSQTFSLKKIPEKSKATFLIPCVWYYFFLSIFVYVYIFFSWS